MKKLLLAGSAAAVALAIFPAFAQVPAPAPVSQRAHMGTAQNRAEVARDVQAMFTRLDTDRNGWLTKAEASAGKEQRRERMGKRGERRADHTFEQLDTDRNGSISRAEFDTAHAQRADHRGDRRDRRAERLDKGGMNRGHVLGGRMFETSDSNNDGRVSLQEATNAALQRFDMADANRDGQITREERSQMRQRMRAERRRG